MFLGKTHPWTDRSGVITLHRLCGCIALGRRLLPSEHVHHFDDDRATARFDRMTVMDHVDHGHWHWYWHGEGSCGHEFPSLDDEPHPERWYGRYRQAASLADMETTA